MCPCARVVHDVAGVSRGERTVVRGSRPSSEAPLLGQRRSGIVSYCSGGVSSGADDGTGEEPCTRQRCPTPRARRQRFGRDRPADQSKPGIHQAVDLSFKAGSLPEGGYYYAVMVLEPYRHYSRQHPPPCSVSSDMQRTDYGYSEAGKVSLALTPAKSIAGHWCLGGSYEGAIYPVPHPPPCNSAIRAAVNRLTNGPRAPRARAFLARLRFRKGGPIPTECPCRKRAGLIMAGLWSGSAAIKGVAQALTARCTDSAGVVCSVR